MIEAGLNYLPRLEYLERVRPFMDSPIIKVFTGQRRSGKSYILYQLMAEIKKFKPRANIIYINTELAEFRSVKTAADLQQLVAARLQKKRRNYLFVDEIQEIAQFEHALKSLFAAGQCDIYCTGSNAHLLSGELATYLAGRYVQIQVHPLSYAEFLFFHRLKNTNEALHKYLKIGGLPYLASLPRTAQLETLAFDYLRNIYESILLRDVIARENIRNSRFLENLTAYLADNIGSLFSASNISRYLKNQRINMPVQTVINYLTALEKAFLIHKVPRSNIGGLKIFEIGEKYYFEDIGLRNALVHNPAGDLAKLMENAVYSFLLQRGLTVTVGKLENKEIDFVGAKQGRRIYVQVVYRIDNEDTRRREFGNLEQVPDQFPKYVVTMDEDAVGVSSKGVRCMHLKDFLLLNIEI
ncbi:MAG: ATP-binding protein [Candidatus Margulisbacteria bacterium]|jgi:predicted AAA+ superfamily ATPase|nr:ATP-binding protein [Candidatus Margulisiibacteriota bacterium]